MRIPNTQFEKITNTTKIPSLRQPYLDADANVLYASDGYVMAAFGGVAEPGDVSGYVHSAVITAARKAGRVDASGDTLRYLDVNTLGDVEVDRRADVPDVSYPNMPWMKSVPDREPDFVIDAQLLLQLAKALNGDGKAQLVRIWVARKGERCCVQSAKNPENYGFIATFGDAETYNI